MRCTPLAISAEASVSPAQPIEGLPSKAKRSGRARSMRPPAASRKAPLSPCAQSPGAQWVGHDASLASTLYLATGGVQRKALQPAGGATNCDRPQPARRPLDLRGRPDSLRGRNSLHRQGAATSTDRSAPARSREGGSRWPRTRFCLPGRRSPPRAFRRSRPRRQPRRPPKRPPFPSRSPADRIDRDGLDRRTRRNGRRRCSRARSEGRVVQQQRLPVLQLRQLLNATDEYD